MNTTWDVVDLIYMVLDTSVVEPGNHGHDWRINLHFPMEMGEAFVDEQEFNFKDKWDVTRPDV
eukprot:12779144-Prorocentrum_lima.AAC.1